MSMSQDKSKHIFHVRIKEVSTYIAYNKNGKPFLYWPSRLKTLVVKMS